MRLEQTSQGGRQMALYTLGERIPPTPFATVFGSETIETVSNYHGETGSQRTLH